MRYELSDYEVPLRCVSSVRIERGRLRCHWHGKGQSQRVSNIGRTKAAFLTRPRRDFRIKLWRRSIQTAQTVCGEPIIEGIQPPLPYGRVMISKKCPSGSLK